MKFLIVTHVIHAQYNNQYFGYEPYVREMNIWLQYVNQLMIVAPVANKQPMTIESAYQHNNIDFKSISEFSINTFKNSAIAFFKIPKITITLLRAMQQADHIHLRCPGNIGLLACVVQILFPKKPKTAKYAGNWDPKARQPWTYRLQKWILSNTFLTRNIQVLVYGDWENQTKNIKPFFTATYSETEKKEVSKTIEQEDTIKILFVGSLVSGKNPMYAIQLIEHLHKLGCQIMLDVYGDGKLRNKLTHYIQEKQLQQQVILHGNQSVETLKKAYQQSHFVILPSKSEGWPKAVAKAMFWGAVPLATPVSCVSDMLDNGNRGLLLQMSLEKDAAKINELINNNIDFEKKSKAASNWSQNYTLELFETEIQKLLQ